MLAKLFWMTVGAGLAVYTMNRPQRRPSISTAGSGPKRLAQDTMAPGDEAPQGTPGTGEAVCPDCGGSGKASAGAPCPTCEGSGVVTVGIGGG